MNELAYEVPAHIRKNRYYMALPENWIILTIASGFVGLIAYLWKGRDRKLDETNDKIDKVLIEIRGLTADVRRNADDLSLVRTQMQVNIEHISNLRTEVAILKTKTENHDKAN